MFRIEKDDLCELEEHLPKIMDACFMNMTPALRIKFRRIQQILSDVRWAYGPPSHVERIDIDGEPEQQ